MVHNASPRFIPDSDREFADMGRSFADTIARDPSRFRLSTSDAQKISKAVAEFRAALSVALSVRTRTKLTIMDKDAARARAVEIIRDYGNRIRISKEISQTDKIAVGVKERSRKQRCGILPQTPPRLLYVGCSDASAGQGGYHILKFWEESVDGIHAKPRGSARVEIFVELVAEDEPIPNHPGELSGGRTWYLRSFTRSPIKVEFPLPASPMLVVYWARWSDSTGNVGPFSKTAVSRFEGWPASLGALSITRRSPVTQTRRLAAVCPRTDRYLEQRCDQAYLLTDDREAGEKMLVDENGERFL